MVLGDLGEERGEYSLGDEEEWEVITGEPPPPVFVRVRGDDLGDFRGEMGIGTDFGVVGEIGSDATKSAECFGGDVFDAVSVDVVERGSESFGMSKGGLKSI